MTAGSFHYGGDKTEKSLDRDEQPGGPLSDGTTKQRQRSAMIEPG